MYHVSCQVGPGAVLLPRSPLVPLSDKEVACLSFLFLWLTVPHPSSKALERGWWVILEEELWFFYGHAQAALWGGQGPALAITTHKSPLSQRELGGQPRLTATVTQERAKTEQTVLGMWSLHNTGHSEVVPCLLRRCRGPWRHQVMSHDVCVPRGLSSAGGWAQLQHSPWGLTSGLLTP